MSNIKNRLQFLRCEEIFKDLDAVKDFREKWEYAHGWKPAEPIVFRYGSEDEAHTVISVGGIDKSQTVYIDIDKIQGDINANNEKTSVIEGNLEVFADALTKFADYCGAKVDGKYKPSEEILYGASSLTDAISKLAEYVSSMSDTIHAKKNDTDTVHLILDDENQIVGADVKVPIKSFKNGVEYDNDLTIGKDGIFANVTLDYDKDKSVLKFIKNGEATTFQLPKEDYIVSGAYDKTTESLVFTMKTGNKVSVDASQLISEWKAESTDSIKLTRERVKYDTGDYDWQDILKAEVRLHPNTHDINNILKTDPSGMYVDGQAKNILFTESDGSVTDLQRKVSEITCEVSKEEGNIIVKKLDGIYASVKFSYDDIRNEITFEDGKSEPKKIILNSFDKIEDDSFRYSEPDNALEFQLLYANGEHKDISIPLSLLWNWFKISDANTPIELSVVDGEVKADVKLSPSNDNLLEVVDGRLYASSSSKNITFNGQSVYDALTSLAESVDEDKTVIAELKATTESHTKRLNNQKSSINKINDRIDSVEEEIRTGNQSVDTKISEVSSRVTALQTEIGTVRNTVTTLSETAATLRSDLSALSAKEASDISTLNASINGISTQIAETNVEVAKKANSSEVSEIRNSLSSYAKTADVERDLETLENSIDSLSARADALSAQIASKGDKTAVDELSSKVSALETELAGVNRTLEALSKTIDDEVSDKLGILQVDLANGDTVYKLTYNGKACSNTDILVPKYDVVGSIVTNVTYDSDTQKLTIEFSNGQKFNFSLKDLVDVYKAGDGLSLTDNTFSVKVDPTSERYLSVSNAGVKVSGISEKFDEFAASINTLTTLANSNKDAIASILTDSTIKNFSDMVRYVDEVKKQLDLHVQSAESEIARVETDLGNKYATLNTSIATTKNELETEIDSTKNVLENEIAAASAKNKGEIHDLEDKLQAEIDKKADNFDVFNRETDTTKSALRLDMKTNGDGQKILYGNVEISTLSDNALKNSNGALYVSNNSKDVVYKNTTVASQLDRLENQIEAITSGGTITVKVVSDDEHNVLHTGSDGGACFDGTLDYGTFTFP